jgi:hypothetical protein
MVILRLWCAVLKVLHILDEWQSMASRGDVMQGE